MTALELRDIWKAFGATQALAGAAIVVKPGEVHALVGANGAGKSTLSRIMSGQIRPDRGSIMLDDEPIRFSNSRDAILHGICMVTQETSLAPDLSVLENIMLPHLALPGRLRWRVLRRQGEALIGELGREAGLDLDTLVGDLSIGQRQLVEILKALALDSRFIIFDEPTAPLSPHEGERLFAIMRRLAARGRGLIFVSHRLEEIFTITDRVTVLREGKLVEGNLPIGDLTQGALVRLMVGRDLQDIYGRRTARPPVPDSEPVVLRVRNRASPPMVRDVSFEVRAGEVLGLAGLVGAGRSETIETIFGLRRAAAGSVELNGQPFAARSSREAIRAGIGLIPEDRRGQAIVPDFSVRENLLLAHLGARAGVGLGYASRTTAIRDLLAVLDLPERRLLDANMLTFSGGMQQKVILARGLLLSPRLLLLDEPTRGVDIATRSSIYALLRRVAAEGMACVVVSSDFEEIIGISDRITVLSDGVSVTTLPSQLVDVEKLAMFAAPRTSAEKTHTILADLVARHGGMAYWIVVDAGRVFCFDRVGTEAAADPGFAAGGFPLLADTVIASALARPAAGFIPSTDGTRWTLLVPIFGQRGHSFGTVGLTLGRAAAGVDAAALSAAIASSLSDPIDRELTETGQFA
jgi:ABC-type sugar transport system ATPase subunit